MNEVAELIKNINSFLWGFPLLVMLLGTHIFMTFRTGFIQKHIFKAIKLSFKKSGGAGDISPFAALMTSLAATIGTGNIVGVATAVTLGGPGAVFWCWITGIFGIATKYGEGFLAIKYRVKTSDGTMLGGPMYALEKGLKQKGLAVMFCIFAALASFGIGSSAQANSISGMLKEQFKISPVVSGVVLAIVIFIVIIGGVKSIANVCEKLVPAMALIYIIGCIVILIGNREYILQAMRLILVSAFNTKAAAGGFVGSTLMTAARYGVARGLFSNESGLGSAPIAAAAAKTNHPVPQALVSMTGTFWDTAVICLMTGLVIVSSIIRFEGEGHFEGLKGAELTSKAFHMASAVGPIVLTLGLATFVFSTILGWSYYGERCIEYLFGKKGILPYKLIYVVTVFLGAVGSLDIVWDFSDIMNAFMAVPNLISLILLSGIIAKEGREYIKNHFQP